MVKLLGKLVGTPQDRTEKKYRPLVQRINDLEPEFERLTDAELRAKTDEFRDRLAGGKKPDDILPEAFAAVREASKRTLGQRHFDVQLIGGVVLHQGNIAEMKTGEGKTLVATLPCYLNALTSDGVHVITVNDYLARRDPVWMGPIFHKLGLSVGCLQHDSSYMYDPSAEDGDSSHKHLRSVPRQEAYRADITYGTNNEYGFDYLRDNMALDLNLQVQRGLHYAIVDEVDNILIDEARTPLIISGPAQEPVQLYYTMAQLAPRLRPEEDYSMIDERSRAISLTEEGMSKIERWIKVDNLYDPENFHLVQYVENALRAYVLYKRDKEYVVKDGEVIIVDEFTGRLQPGRRWADGLHQAIEAKEGIKVQRESTTYATITLQNYFRMYNKLAGMTGTAATEAEEFLKIYRLDVVIMPTNALLIRTDLPDLIYQSEAAKWTAVANDIEEMHKEQRPVLVGTTSIENSERLSELLRRRGVPHQVLNAKQHESESHIVAQAGRPGAITVATNMAGRGTDIVLGGNPDNLDITREEWQRDHDAVIAQGGLTVVGTEHHEARRIDNQLRGRSGRQGDPGTTRFYASMEDEIIKRFGGERAKSVMGKVSGWAGLDKDAPLESGMITKILSSAQSKVEGYHFETRKHLLEFDDVLNLQRGNIYNERKKILIGTDLRSGVLQMVKEEIEKLVALHLSATDVEDWDFKALLDDLRTIFPMLPAELNSEGHLARLSREEIEEGLIKHSQEMYDQKEAETGSEEMRTLERLVMLRSLDIHWVQHLTSIEKLRQGVSLQAYGQRNPLVAYQTEGRRMYHELLDQMRHDVVHSIYKVALKPAASSIRTDGNGSSRGRPQSSPMAAMGRKETVAVGARKIGRNEPCHCGSGKKYKRCHGAG
ncbi:MAG: preprotein translocase subunit SecA [Chloroflexi bacterium]|nr:preprotein translocase subunit SecA [Chloroflexota bacterium]